METQGIILPFAIMKNKAYFNLMIQEFLPHNLSSIKTQDLYFSSIRNKKTRPTIFEDEKLVSSIL